MSRKQEQEKKINEEVSADAQTEAQTEADDLEDFFEEFTADTKEHNSLKGYVLNWKKQGGELIATGLKKCNANIVKYVLDRDLIYDFRFNTFANYAERRDGDSWRRIIDNDLLDVIARISTEAEGEAGDHRGFKSIKGWDISKQLISDIIIANARRCDPVKEYFESLQWDGVKRVDTLLHDVLGADENEYTKAVMWLMLLGIISRIYKPGTKFDYMVILQGRQGCGKSSFLQALAVNPEWYGSIGAAHMQDRKLLGEDAAGKIILEYEELDGIRKTTNERLKAAITRQTDQYRQAYSVNSEEHPRRYVLTGTTNKGQYLSDETGNRRYLPIPITKKGFMSTETVNQVWAEAYAKYTEIKDRDDFKLYLPEKIEGLANEYRGVATRLISDDFTEAIVDFLDGGTPDGTPRPETKVIDVYNAVEALNKMPYEKAAPIIRTALHVLGWENRLIKRNGEVKRVYIRPENP